MDITYDASMTPQAQAVGQVQSSFQAPSVRAAKREQVARACQRCANGKRKCSGTFPCERCIRLGLSDSCVEVSPATALAAARGTQMRLAAVAAVAMVAAAAVAG